MTSPSGRKGLRLRHRTPRTPPRIILCPQKSPERRGRPVRVIWASPGPAVGNAAPATKWAETSGNGGKIKFLTSPSGRKGLRLRHRTPRTPPRIILCPQESPKRRGRPVRVPWASPGPAVGNTTPATKCVEMSGNGGKIKFLTSSQGRQVRSGSIGATGPQVRAMKMQLMLPIPCFMRTWAEA